MVMNNAWNSRNPAVEIKGGTGQNSYVAGDLLYASASNTLAKLPIGPAGYVFGSNGTIPGWVPSGSGSLIHIEKLTAASDPFFTFTNAITDAYEDYMIVISQMQASEDTNTVQMQLSSDNGATWITTSSYSYYNRRRKFDDGVLLTNFSSSDTKVELTADGDVKDSSGAGFNATIYLYDPYGTSAKTRISYKGNYLRQQFFGSAVDLRGSAALNTASRTDAIRFYFFDGNISSGTIAIYGIINS